MLRKAAKPAEDTEMQLMSTDTEITATLSRMERQLQVLATAQKSTTATFNTRERSISIFNHTRQPSPARRVTFTDNNRPHATAAGYVQPPQQRVYTNFDSRHDHSNLQCSTPEWTERWLPSTHRAQRDRVLQPDASNYNMSPMLRCARFQTLSF